MLHVGFLQLLLFYSITEAEFLPKNWIIYPKDIVFIIDAPVSLGEGIFPKELNLIESMINYSTIGPYDTQIGFVTRLGPQFHLNTFSNQQDILNHLRNKTYTKNDTGTVSALGYAADKSFSLANGIRSYAVQIAIVFADRNAGRPKPTHWELEKLKDKGVTVISIPADVGVAPAERHATEDDDFSYPEHVKETLQEKVLKADPAYKCIGKADIVFLLHQPGYRRIEHNRFSLLKNAVFDTIDDFFIGPDHVQVGVDMFTTKFVQHVSLSQSTDRSHLRGAIGDIDHIMDAGGMDVGNAIRLMRKRSFSAEAGLRAGVPQIAVILLNGPSHNTSLTVSEARKTRDAGITILDVYIGPEMDTAEKYAVASGDGEENVYSVYTYEGLSGIQRYVTFNLCGKLQQGPPSGASSDATCGTKADIVFLLDSSVHISKFRFNFMRLFVATFIKELDIGLDKIRVGVVNFDSLPSRVFSLNHFNNTRDMATAIRRMKYTDGGCNTSAALRFMDEIMFKPANGDRPGVPNIAIVMTSSTSDNPEDTKAAAERARANGVVIFSVGVGFLYSRSNLDAIATDPDNVHVLLAGNASKLTTIKSALKARICTAIPVTTTVEPDITCEDNSPNCGNNSGHTAAAIVVQDRRQDLIEGENDSGYTATPFEIQDRRLGGVTALPSTTQSEDLIFGIFIICFIVIAVVFGLLIDFILLNMQRK